jgi:hypothetical protein|tara:strand:- start:5181 stop:5552 length:372 start_codon:yes stop_codon:yes gene_type:complete
MVSIKNELGERPTERFEKTCEECDHSSPIYNLDKIHYLDGDQSNKLHSNTAVICPRCESHIILSAYTPKDIWELKMKGMGNAEIGRLLGISRERIRQLCKKYQNQTELDRLEKLLEKLIPDEE